MSDHSISIVPRQLTYRGDRESKASEIVQWLIEEQAIEPTLNDCDWGVPGIYRFKENFARFSSYPQYLCLDLRLSGLEVIMKRTVFDTMANGLEDVRCPFCRSEIAEEMFFDLIENWWHEKSDAHALTCPSCGETVSLDAIITEPEWGASDLGFTFWNCPPFIDEFITEFEKRLESPVWVVYRHI